MLTDQITIVDFNKTVRDEYDKVIIQQDPKLLEKAVDLINQTFFTDDYDLSMKIKSYHQTKEALNQLQSSTQQILISDLILGFVVKSNKSNDLKEVAFIESLRFGLAVNKGKISLKRDEMDKLKKLVLESEMVSILKAQVIDYIDSGILKLMNENVEKYMND